MHAPTAFRKWSSIIAAFEKSGASHAAFCAQRGLNIGTFRQWLYRIRATSSAPSTEIALLPVEVTPPAQPSAGGEIIIAVADIEVRVAVGLDIAYVAHLVAELRARC